MRESSEAGTLKNETNGKSKLPGCIAIGSVILAVIGLVVFLVFEFNASRGRLAVGNRLDAIRKEGLPTNAVELDEYYRIADGAEDITADWLDPINAIEAITSDGRDMSKIPFLGGEVELEHLALDGNDWPGMTESKTFLALIRPELSKLHNVAKKEGDVRYPVDLSEGYLALLEHCQSARNAARCLKLEAFDAAHRGDAEAVTQSLETMVKLGQTLEDEPLLVSQLVHIAIYSIAIEAYLRVIPVVEFNADQQDRLAKRFKSTNYSQCLKTALIGERAASIDVFLNPAKLSGLGETVPMVMGPRHADLMFYLDTTEEMIAAAERPFPDAITAADQIDEQTQEVLNSDSFFKNITT